MKILTLIRLMNITSTYAEVSKSGEIMKYKFDFNKQNAAVEDCCRDRGSYYINRAHIQFIYLINKFFVSVESRKQ